MAEAETKEAHTPGEWTIRPSRDGSGDVGIAASGTYIVAEAFADIRHSGERSVAEALANARLIAAAPTMLDVLRKAEDELRRCGLDCVDSDERTDTLLTEIRATIQRAEA